MFALLINKYKFICSYLLFVSPTSFALSQSFKLPTDIQFTGSVVTPAPNWKWEFHPTTINWANNWIIAKKEGVKIGDGTTRFNHDVRRNTFVHGLMVTPANRGRPDILPVVSILVDGGSLDLRGNATTQQVEISAIGRNDNGNNVPGKLLFSVDSAYAVFYKRTSDEDSYYCESYLGSTGWAGYSVIRNNMPADYNFKPGGVEKLAQKLLSNKDSSYEMTTVISGVGTPVPDAYDILAGFTSNLRGFSTVWREIPYTWTATLTFNVRIN